jgi:hypothetical protein
MTGEDSTSEVFKARTESPLPQSTGGRDNLAALDPYVMGRRVPIWYQLDP